MKKLLAVLLLALVATPALATIDNSKHDLQNGATDEVCVYCHTPHNANTTGYGAGAPLWNRSGNAPGLTGVYSSTTLNASISGTYTNIDAPLCMSCHQGAVAMNSLVNGPNSAGGTALNANSVLGNAIFDLNMSNDHPINFNFAAAQSLDSEIYSNPGSEYKFNGGIMQCSTCHDVHNTVGVKLLVVNNAGSAMCLDCHAK